jgi:hypothetical protein
MVLFQSLWTWLLTPISGNPVHDISVVVSWHARLMVLSWGVLLPLGVCIARFYKVTPNQKWPEQLDNKLWWHAHLLIQIVGLSLAILGLILIGFIHSKTINTHLAQWHGYLGWLVMTLGLLQAGGGMLRGSKGGPTDAQLRGDHYDMTRRRRVFEWVHKTGGYLALLLALCVIGMGLLVSDAPRWMPAVLIVWWLGLGFCFLWLQGRGRCFDTYQAIWGDSPEHPGNHLTQSGWVSRRYSRNNFSSEFNNARLIKKTNFKGQHDE